MDTQGTPRIDVVSSYSIVKSPAETSASAKKLEDGAIRVGPRPQLFSWKLIGLVVQFAALGMINHMLTDTAYPFLFNYCRLTSVEVASAKALLNLIWTLKIFVGIISDCCPIAGYHRRPYIVLGWIICFTALFAMAVMKLPDPYYPVAKWANLKSLTKAQKAQLNPEAHATGVRYMVLMCVAKFGMMIALTTAEGVLVDVAQRELEHERGTVIAITSLFKFGFGILSGCFTGFGLNGPEYGGSFSSSLGFNLICGVCSVFAVAGMGFGWFCIEEERVAGESVPSFKYLLGGVYEFMQHRVVYQVVAFQFVHSFFSSFDTTANTNVQSSWAEVEPVAETVALTITYGTAFVFSYTIKRWGLHWNWRTLVVVIQVAAVIIAAIPTFITVFNVERNQWLWIFSELPAQLPGHTSEIVTSFAVVELLDLGNEATMFGLLLTIPNLASPFATVVYKNIDVHFNVKLANIVKDTHTVRMHVFYTYLIAFLFNLFSVVFVLWLPRQKKETQELKNNGGKSKLMGALTIAYLAFAFCWSVMTNCMTFSSTTSCMRIAGGVGCKKSK